MSASQAKAGYGSLLKIGNGASPEVFSTILENVNIDPPFDAADIIEVTNHDSPGGYKEFTPTLLDAGEISGEGNFVFDSTQTSVRTALTGKTRTNFQFVVPLSTPKTCSFAAIVTQWAPKTPLKDRMTYQFKLRVTGQPSWA